MKTAVVVGNPKAKSRTLEAGCLVARRLTGTEADLVVDLVDFGPALLEWGQRRGHAIVGGGARHGRGGGRQPDVQGDLYRPPEIVPGPVSKRRTGGRDRLSGDAGRGTGTCACTGP